jgi:lipopolysaccharide/colanic/teichoic acid biosynthesis glycosyltransferase
MSATTQLRRAAEVATLGSRRSAAKAAKRALDVFLAAVLLALVAPLLLLLVVLVRLDSPGPSFYACRRVGRDGRPLRMLKLRKMVDDAAGAALTTADDARFTRVGRWLAKYKLDELPQLWHVVRGEMSLVGPRPEDPGFVAAFADEFHDGVLTVRPGITGLSQLAFANEGRALDAADPIKHYHEVLLPQKLELDRLYARHAGPWTDLRILFWTFVTVVLRRPVAVHRKTGHINLRHR